MDGETNEHFDQIELNFEHKMWGDRHTQSCDQMAEGLVERRDRADSRKRWIKVQLHQVRLGLLPVHSSEFAGLNRADYLDQILR